MSSLTDVRPDTEQIPPPITPPDRVVAVSGERPPLGRRVPPSADEVESRVPDQRVLQIVGLGLKQKHPITQCPGCAGPRIHSKQGRGMRCFGCGQYWDWSPWPKTRYCDICKKPLTDPNRKERCLSCAKSRLK